jgi:hypothetical protein
MSDDWTSGSVWQHMKSGHVYSVIGTCRLEATNAPAVLYARPEDGFVWARDMDEFLDGRFARISMPAMGLMPHERTAPEPATSGENISREEKARRGAYLLGEIE